MKKIYSLSLLIIILMGSISAQSFVGKINPYQLNSFNELNVPDTLKILAVMVEFEPDEDNATFGDGTFGSIYSENYGNDIIDPLPHDKTYFSNHLLFAKNYFEKVSNGKLTIEYTILEQIIRLPKIMREYSPEPANRDDFTRLVNMTSEVWSHVERNTMIAEPADYNLFAIFHAGVGRDIDVPGSIGNDRDLPSVYLSYNAFESILGDQFDGFQVSNLSSKITNTMILPETESRELSGIGEKVLLELSINGLIVASIASHLGLPDLFNTETGLSAIGRFGLMDGQSIFSFGGLFPPEPSPWEKIYLGWVDPVELVLTDMKINLTVEESAGFSDTTLVKIPINSSEYYLVENRSRDANGDGCLITYRVGDQTFQKSFDKDYSSFISFNIDTLSGVVTDVDEFDWALPAFDRNDSDLESFSDIGLVIWHIDETVINEKITLNQINNDKFRKGVAVVEADGIPDIGEEFQTIFGDIVIGEGSKEDTWYSSNPAEFYTNRFADNTKPSSKSNTGANSLITLSNFSGIGKVMSFDLDFGSDVVRQISSFKLPADENIRWVNASDKGYYYFISESKIIQTDAEGNTISERDIEAEFKPAFYDDEFNDYFIFSDGNELTLLVYQSSGAIVRTITGISEFTTSPVITNTNPLSFSIGTNSGSIADYIATSSTGYQITSALELKIFNDAVRDIAEIDINRTVVSDDSWSWDKNHVSSLIPLPAIPLKIITTYAYNKNTSAVLLNDNSLWIKNLNSDPVMIPVAGSLPATHLSAGDLKSDGGNYFVVNANDRIDAYNASGGVADNFPIYCPDDASFVGTPLVLDFNSDNYSDVLISADNGNVYLFSGNDGKIIAPFPVSLGYEINNSPLIFNGNNGTGVIFNDINNTISIWELSDSQLQVDWSQEKGNSLNTSSLGEPDNQNKIESFFPKNRAYSWPNPVYDTEAYFRFYVSEDSEVEINIFDLAGDYVDKINYKALGGFDNEVLWDVSYIQSGVYLAHMNVKNSSGTSDYKIIKVAVIK
ncbi:MAG: T9SS type A sorting domain-containing protein [Melioribacteraceae bacterium]|nr:T9SS type A sorting domain-containing protein [Melioribacteraceae bacterium]